MNINFLSNPTGIADSIFGDGAGMVMPGLEPATKAAAQRAQLWAMTKAHLTQRGVPTGELLPSQPEQFQQRTKAYVPPASPALLAFFK